MRLFCAVVVVGVLTLTLTVPIQGQQFHRNPFESRDVLWQKGAADAPVQNERHELTTQTAHSGQQSEAIRFTADSGTYLHYTYQLGKVEVVDELMVTLWVKANRPGTQLLARLVLPREKDPQRADQPLTTLLRGEIYQLAGRWQRLELRNPRTLVNQQKQLLTAERGAVNFEDAYIESVILNVYSGKGLTEVYIDDLEVGPIYGDLSIPGRAGPRAEAAPGQPGGGRAVPGSPVKLQTPRHVVISMNNDQLLVNRKPFLVRGIRYSDTPLKALRDAGFNTLFVDAATPEKTLEEAANLGFFLVPELGQMEEVAKGTTVPAAYPRAVTNFPANDAVLFWHLGNGLTAEQDSAAARAAAAIRQADPFPGRPISANVWDGFQPYARSLEMVSIHRWPLLTGLELSQYREWLVQRVRLASTDSYLWTWIQTHLPEWYLSLVYGKANVQGFDEPIGPQPEQIRLLTYIALAAGYRGVGFWSDRFLANSHHGRDRLLAMALLNQELEMLAPVLASAKAVEWVKCKPHDVQAAVLRYDGGVLVLPMWLGKGAQFCPGQLAANNLEMVIPGAPNDAQVWEVTPGDVRAVPTIERVAGGTKIVLPEFGVTTALVLTANMERIGELQLASRRLRRLAAQWAYELVAEEYAKVEKVNAQLEQLGHAQPDATQLLNECRRRADNARQAYGKRTTPDDRVAYEEAQRALRPLRILMRAHWETAVKALDGNLAVSSPYAVSFYTLPRHWQFVEEQKSARVAPNALANGDFELPPNQAPAAWSLQEVTLDEVDLAAERVAEKPREGRQCLRLQVKPRDPKNPPEALERTFLAITTPQVRMPPGALARVSGWVRIPEPIKASVDGALFFDSIGGEPLAVRLTEKTEKWKQFTLVRRVPDSGLVSVTMALTGLGTVYFDDVRIEPLFPGQGQGQAAAGQPATVVGKR